MNIWKIALCVEDLEAAANFYTNILGMKEVKRKGASISLDAGGVRLELIDKKVFAADPRMGKLGVQHLSFRVDDIEKTAQELKAKGVKFLKDPVDRGGGLKIGFFDGLNDVNLQLYELKE